MYENLISGLYLLVLGLSLFFGIWGIAKILQHRRPAPAPLYMGAPAFSQPPVENEQEAILFVMGGRVEYINARGRALFGLKEEDVPDLEVLTRRSQPAGDFLDLCAWPGEKHLVVNGQRVEGRSYVLPVFLGATLVRLMPLDVAKEDEHRLVDITADFIRAVGSSLDLSECLRAIAYNLARLFPFEFIEIKLRHPETGWALYTFSEKDGYAPHPAILSASRFGEKYLQLSVERPFFLLNASEGDETGVGSYLGLLLDVEGEIAGALEIGARAAGTLSEEDAFLLEKLRAPLSILLRNALRYQQLERSLKELSGPVRLTQVMELTGDPQELFSHLVEYLRGVFSAEVLGFLIYDPERRLLYAQKPFYGLPDYVVEMYQSSIPAGRTDEIMPGMETIEYTSDPGSDPLWVRLGLHTVALAAGLHHAVLVPLTVGDELVGYLQIASYPTDTSFTEEQKRLLETLRPQLSSIVKNALLVQQARQRLQRAESLRRIAHLVVSDAQLDDILKFSMQELARLFQADFGAICFLNEEHGRLEVHKPSLWNVPLEQLGDLEALYVGQDYYQTISGAQRPFLSNRLSRDERVLPLYQGIVERFGVESSMVVPLAVHGRSLGELMIGHRAPNAFHREDLQTVSAAAAQITIAIESHRLGKLTDEALRKRLDLLSAITRISRELHITLDLTRVMRVIHEEGLRLLRADCGSIYLLGQDGDTPSVERLVGCETSSLLPYEMEAIQKSQTLILEFSASENLPVPHEDVRSVLVSPIRFGEKVIGLMDFHSRRRNGFDDPEAIQAIEMLATQAGIALNNARLYAQELEQAALFRLRAQALRELADLNRRLDPTSSSLEEALHEIALSISRVSPFDVVLISVYQPETGLLQRITGVGLAPETMRELLVKRQPWSALQALLRPEFRVDQAYFLPFEQMPVLPPEVHTVTLERASEIPQADQWHPEDLLLFPLLDARGEPTGLISVDLPRDKRRPDRVTIEIIQAFAAQATQWIAHFRQLAQAKLEIERSQVALQRQQMLISVTQEQLPLLLRNDLGHILALHTLESRQRRIRALLGVTGIISQQIDITNALAQLGRELLTRLEMSAVLIAEETAEGPILRHIFGNVPPEAQVETLFGQRNPLRNALQNGELILVSALEESDDWRDTPLLNALRAKGFLCLPLIVGEHSRDAVLAISQQPLPPFTEEDRLLYAQVSRQIAIILQNISLLAQTRRRLQEVNLLLEFSRRAAGAEPLEVLELFLENVRRVVTSAHAGVVLLWNEREQSLEVVTAQGYMDSRAMLQLRYRGGKTLPEQVFDARRPRRVAEVNFIRDYPLEPELLELYRRAVGQRLPVSSLLVPIQSATTAFGLILLDNFNQAQAFSQADEDLVLALAQQVSLFLENARLIQAAQERARQMEVLSSIVTELTAYLRREDIVGTLLDRLKAVVPYDMATLWLREDERLRVFAVRGFTEPEAEYRMGLSLVIAESALVQEMLRTAAPLSVGDVRRDARFPSLEVTPLSWLGLPLMVKGELLGLIVLEKWEAHFYTQEKVQVAMTFASQAAIALENARLFDESQQRAAELDERSQRLSLLNRLSASLAATLDAEKIMRFTAEELFSALEGEFVSTVVFEQNQPRLSFTLPAVRMLSPELPLSPLFQRFMEGSSAFVTEKAAEEPDLQPLSLAWRPAMPYLLALPLMSGEQLRAVYLIQRTRSPFTSAEIELARTMANQTTLALENARLYQSTLRTAERFAILNQVSAEIAFALSIEDLVHAVHQAATRLFPLDAFVFSLANEPEQAVDVIYLVDKGELLTPMRLKWGQGISGYVIASGETILTHTLDEVRALRAAPRGELPASILAVPVRQGEKIAGAISVQSYRSHAYTEEDLQIFSTLASQVGVALQNVRLFAEVQTLAESLEQRVQERTAELEREKHYIEVLLRILSEVSATLDLNRALKRTLGLLNEAVGAEQGTILLLDPEDSMLYYRAGYGYVSEQEVEMEMKERRGFRIGEGLAGWVAAHREAVLVEDLTKDPRWVPTQTSREHRSAVVVPLMVGENVLGVLMVFHRQPRFFNEESLNLIRAIAGQVSVAINNANLYELIREQSERLGQLYRQQAEEASRSQAILESVADGVLVTDAANRISFLNRSAERILGIEASRILGQPLSEFAGLFGKAAREWIRTIRYWSETPSAYRSDESYVERIELEDGKVILVHLAPVILQNEFLGTVSIFRDITHEVEVERLKSEFVATVSHELRTPMTSIRGYVDLLLMGAAGVLNEMQSNFLNVIKSNTDRLNALVADLLDISRIEAGRVSLTPQPINLVHLVEESLNEMRRRSQQENKPMTFSLEAEPDLPMAFGDAERIRQILDNLLENAYSYTPAGGRVQVRLHRSDSELQVDVQDNGIGIPPQEQARVFERFYRGENPLVIETPGTGLGLSIVRQLVEMHGGRIWVTSTGVYGEGSTFSFTLPVYRTDVQDERER